MKAEGSSGFKIRLEESCNECLVATCTRESDKASRFRRAALTSYVPVCVEPMMRIANLHESDQMFRAAAVVEIGLLAVNLVSAYNQNDLVSATTAARNI